MIALAFIAGLGLAAFWGFRTLVGARN